MLFVGRLFVEKIAMPLDFYGDVFAHAVEIIDSLV